MNSRTSHSIAHQPIQLWLFVGILLFATLAVPAIALVTRALIADLPAAEQSDTTAQTGERAEGPAPVLKTVVGSSSCQNGLMSDRILIDRCPRAD